MSVSRNADALLDQRRTRQKTSQEDSQDTPLESAEKSLIGCLLFDPDRTDEVCEAVAADEIRSPACRAIFEAIVRMRLAGKAVDGVTLASEMAADGSLSDIGGEDFIAECAEAVPYAHHATHYATLIREKALRRFTAWRCADGIVDAKDETQDIEHVIGKIEGSLHSILERKSSASQTSIRDVLALAMAQIGAGKSFGVSTGFDELDNMLNGWQPGSLVILAARPSVGKTALAIRFLMNAGREGVPAMMFSLEQSATEVAERILSMESHIPVTTMRQRSLSEEICDRIMMNSAIVGEWPIEIDDNSARNVTSIASIARLMKRRRGIRVVIVDYLQLIQPTDRKWPREQQVADISRNLKLMAKQLGVTVICLAQLNRQIEGRTEKKPVLSDLRESGAIEQDADVVMMIDRPKSYDEMADANTATLCVRKNRNGATGDVPMYWDGPTMTFKPGTRHGEYHESESDERDWTR